MACDPPWPRRQLLRLRHEVGKGARQTARELVARLRPVAQDLGCEAELDGVSDILRRGTGADLQRAAYEKRGSLEDVVEYLLGTTTPH